MTVVTDPFAAAPQLMKQWMGVSLAVQDSLEPSLIELVKIRASILNACANCINMHTAEARAKGETEQRIYLLAAWHEAPVYTPRERAALAGARRETGNFEFLSRDADGTLVVHYSSSERNGPDNLHQVRTRLLVGADGARSRIARQAIPGGEEVECVFAYHEIVSAPAPAAVSGYDGSRCDVYYQGRLSPDFYGWVFPHGETTSVGVGSAVKGFDLRAATKLLRKQAGLVHQETIREEGAPLPLKPLRRWDNGRDAVLVGDAAGVVAPSSGEGIYYAMLCGRLAAEAAVEFLATGDTKALAQVRKRFMRLHGRVFMVLGFMQRFWYRSDKRRERFVAICEDPDVQRLVWESYLNKRFVRTDPLAHLRVFFKDIGHLLRMAFQ